MSTMKIVLDDLLANAFFSAPAEDATRALAEAHDRFTDETGLPARALEVVVPAAVTRRWLDALARSIVYPCECTGLDVPRCPGVFVAFFRRGRVHCVAAATVLAFVGPILDVRPDELSGRYGTQESHRISRPPP